MIKVIKAKANDDFTLDLTFSEGSEKNFNMVPYMEYEIFQKLNDLTYFKQVDIAYGTVRWPDEQDISPDTYIWRA